MIAELAGEPQGSGDLPSDDTDVQFSANGKRMLTNTGRTIRVWDNQQRLIAEYPGYAAALSADGRQIVVASEETNASTIWQVDDVEGLLKRSCDWLHFAIAFSRDDRDRQICNIENVNSGELDGAD